MKDVCERKGEGESGYKGNRRKEGKHAYQMVHMLGKAGAKHSDGRVGRVEAELRGPWV